MKIIRKILLVVSAVMTLAVAGMNVCAADYARSSSHQAAETAKINAVQTAVAEQRSEGGDRLSL